jgi:hypothetical protein
VICCEAEWHCTVGPVWNHVKWSEVRAGIVAGLMDGVSFVVSVVGGVACCVVTIVRLANDGCRGCGARENS